MAKRTPRSQDPIERIIDDALRPSYGDFESEGGWYPIGLWTAAEEIAKLAGTDPGRAVKLYERLISACDAIAKDLNDGGEFTSFAEALFPSWTSAWQAGSDSGETGDRIH